MVSLRTIEPSSSENRPRFTVHRLEPIIGLRRRQRLAPFARARAFVRTEKVHPALVLAFFAAHVPLALLMSRSVWLTTLHAFVTIAGSLWLAAFSKKIERVAYAAAYITGAEVLWRMTDAYSFWEIGKYGVAAVFIVAMIRHWRVKPSIFPLLYFALLVPAAFLTIKGLPLSEWRQLLSSDLSGPFALMVAGCFFSQLTLTREELLRMFLILIGPVIGVAAVAFFGLATAEEISFGSSSNFEASGGFGPNQVSSILGAGVLVCFLVLLHEKVDLRLKLPTGGLMIFFAAQSALTFSRGGLYNVAGAILLASLLLLKDARTRVQFVLVVAIVIGGSYFVVLPRLDAFTDGALSARFEDTSTTGREEIARMDLDIWQDNPTLGVGPGRATEHRAEMGFEVSAHTEFTRLLAEHGILGLVALLVFLAAIARNFIKAGSAQEKALVVALSGWTFLYMLNAGMRLVAPAMMFGLTFAYFRPAGKEVLVTPKQNRSKKPVPRIRRLRFPNAVYTLQSRRLS